MKKIIGLFLLTFTFINAQESGFKAGLHVGLPSGDASDFYSLNLGFDVAYIWEVSNEFSSGITTGYTTFLGKDFLGVTLPSPGFVPVAATANYKLGSNFFVGTDFGYVFGVSNADDFDDVYYQPKFGYTAETFEAYAGYKGIGDFQAITLGVNFRF